MQNILQSYIPEKSIPKIEELLAHEKLDFIVKKERKTRHGDYRKLPNGRHLITVNANLNPYRFLITLIHEIAHFESFQKYGRHIKPHGKEWKHTFQHLMLPFLNPDIFPKELLPLLAKHFINPKATSDTDHVLALALKQFDENSDKTYIFEIPEGSLFKIYNGRQFKKGNKRVKRFECIEIKTGKVYLFNPNVEIEVI
ncbi:SprT-like domain-containing protein [uncultured Formosa sp.]|uniref:SprT-like domain-containing protein n=1 Tax=uncultured Formosa sp. TaxID=255435 RepID=UPI002610682F|nr:SprT-like domain-containing protein [uncultured Formosa sp.]